MNRKEIGESLFFGRKKTSNVLFFNRSQSGKDYRKPYKTLTNKFFIIVGVIHGVVQVLPQMFNARAGSYHFRNPNETQTKANLNPSIDQ